MEVQLDPRVFHEFYANIALPMRLPDTSRKILEEFVDIDVNSEVVSRIVSRNQYFEHMLMQRVKVLGVTSDTPSLKASIVLLGMQGVRDLMCSMQIIRQIAHKHPASNERGQVEFRPEDYVKYARRTEEYIVARRLPAADMAFAAGVMFDMLEAIGTEVYKAPKSYFDYLEETYKHGLKTARIGWELSQSFKNFAYGKYVFALCLVHDVGKVVMDLLFPLGKEPSYYQFRKDIEKKDLPRDVRLFLEAARFGLTHDYYSYVCCYFFGLFRGLEKALLFHHKPYILRSSKANLFNVAALVSLATNMSYVFKIPHDDNDPVFNFWRTPDLKDFPIDNRRLTAVAHGLSRETF